MVAAGCVEVLDVMVLGGVAKACGGEGIAAAGTREAVRGCGGLARECGVVEANGGRAWSCGRTDAAWVGSRCARAVVGVRAVECSVACDCGATAAAMDAAGNV